MQCTKVSFHSHLIDELYAVQKHVVLVMLVHHLLVDKVPRLQCWVICGGKEL